MSERRRAPEWLLVAAAVSGRLLVVAVAVALVLWALGRLLLVVVPLIVALLLATVLLPVARLLERTGMPRALAALGTVLGSVALFVGVVGFTVPQFVDQLGALAAEVDLGVETLLDLAGDYLGISTEQAQEWIDRGQEQLEEQAGAITGGVVAGAVVLFEFATGAVLTLVILFFLLKDREQITAWIMARTPADRRADVAAGGARAWDTLAGYFRGQAIIAFVDAAGIGLGLLIIGVPLVVPLTVLTFLAGFFPIVGAVFAGLVAVLVALVDGGITDALLVLAVVIGVQQTESNILEPVVLGRAVPLHPLVILVVITAGAVTAGIVGAFLAVPVAAVVAAVGNELRLRHEGSGAQAATAREPEPSPSR